MRQSTAQILSRTKRKKRNELIELTLRRVEMAPPWVLLETTKLLLIKVAKMYRNNTRAVAVVIQYEKPTCYSDCLFLLFLTDLSWRQATPRVWPNWRPNCSKRRAICKDLTAPLRPPGQLSPCRWNLKPSCTSKSHFNHKRRVLICFNYFSSFV